MAKRIREEEIFPRNPNTYGLMEMVKGSSPRVHRGPEDMVSSWPHLLIREALLFAATFIIVLALALFDPPPLDKHSDPTKPPNPAKAPWYFLGLQEMVSYDAFWGGIGIPGLLILALMWRIPYFDRHHSGIGRWFAPSRRTACVLFTLLFVIPSIVLIIIGTYFRGPNWDLTRRGICPRSRRSSCLCCSLCLSQRNSCSGACCSWFSVGLTGVRAIWNNQNASTHDFVYWKSLYRNIAGSLATTAETKKAAAATSLDVEQYTLQQFPFLMPDGTTQQRTDRCEVLPYRR